jgi:hypothetical protein
MAASVGDVREPCEVHVGCVHRRVHGVVGEIEEERLRPFAPEVGHGAIGQLVGEVRRPCRRRTAVEQRIGGVLANIAVRMPAAEKPEELVETALHRVEPLARPQVPLAEERRVVPGGVQPIGQRALGDGQAEFPGRRSDVNVELVPEPLRIAAGQQAGSRRTAVRSRYVRVGEPDAASGERVDVRCPDVAAAVHAEVGVAHVVGDDQQDVRPCALGTRQSDRAEQNGEERDANGKRSRHESLHVRLDHHTLR